MTAASSWVSSRAWRVARLASKLQIKAGPEFAAALEQYEAAYEAMQREIEAETAARSQAAKAGWAKRRASREATASST